MWLPGQRPAIVCQPVSQPGVGLALSLPNRAWGNHVHVHVQPSSWRLAPPSHLIPSRLGHEWAQGGSNHSHGDNTLAGGRAIREREPVSLTVCTERRTRPARPAPFGMVTRKSDSPLGCEASPLRPCISEPLCYCRLVLILTNLPSHSSPISVTSVCHYFLLLGLIVIILSVGSVLWWGCSCAILSYCEP